MLTFLPVEEINKMDDWEGAQLNTAKEILAYELTKLVHGEEEANKAQEAARALFAGGGNSEHMPTTELTDDDFMNGTIDICGLLVKGEMTKTRSEARRAVEQGGVTVNDEKVMDVKKAYTKEELTGVELIVKKGKKSFHKFTV